MAGRPKRPLTQREIRKSRKEKQEEEYIIIHNICKQMVPIQLKAPIGVDFYRGEQTINLNRGKSAKFPKSRLRMPQITNLQKSRMIKVSTAN